MVCRRQEGTTGIVIRTVIAYQPLERVNGCDEGLLPVATQHTTIKEINKNSHIDEILLAARTATWKHAQQFTYPIQFIVFQWKHKIVRYRSPAYTKIQLISRDV